VNYLIKAMNNKRGYGKYTEKKRLNWQKNGEGVNLSMLSELFVIN
jgi:hypothetical protein